MKFKSKCTLTPATPPKEGEAPAAKSCCLCDCCDKAGEVEAKMSFISGLAHTLKLHHPVKRCIPKVTLTNFFKYDPCFLGLSYTFDHTLPKKTENAEVMLGLEPCKNFFAYLKQYESSSTLVARRPASCSRAPSASACTLAST